MAVWFIGLWCLSPLLTIFVISWRFVLLVEETEYQETNVSPFQAKHMNDSMFVQDLSCDVKITSHYYI